MGSWVGQVVAMSDKKLTVGELVFSDIDSNEFLKQLYANLLYNYGLHRLGLADRHPYDVDLEAALRFADLLSKSIHPTNRDRHRVWAQKSRSCATFSTHKTRERKHTFLQSSPR